MSRTLDDLCRAFSARPVRAAHGGGDAAHADPAGTGDARWLHAPVAAALALRDRPVLTDAVAPPLVFLGPAEARALLSDPLAAPPGLASAVLALVPDRGRAPESEALAAGLAGAGLRVVLFPEAGGVPGESAAAASAALADAPALAAVVAAADLEALRARASEHLAADAAAGARLVSSGMTVLTQVARRGGVEAVVVELAHRLQGWGVLLDTEGAMIASAGAGRLHIDDAVAVALTRPVRVRHPDLQVFPVGSGRDLRAYLVVSSRSGSTSRARDLASQAAALLDLVLRTHDHTALERLGREVMVRALDAGYPGLPTEILARWGYRGTRLQAFVLSSRSRSIVLEQLVLQWLDELGQAHLITTEGDRVLGYIAPGHADALADLVRAAAERDRLPVRCGIGSPAGLEELEVSLRQARRAHEVAVADPLPVSRYRELPTVGLILEALDPTALGALRTPLERLRAESPDADTLIEAARVFLVEHGSMQRAAERLGAHRHTLRKRLERFEAGTGLSMSNLDDRFALWMALRATEEER